MTFTYELDVDCVKLNHVKKTTGQATAQFQWSVVQQSGHDGEWATQKDDGTFSAWRMGRDDGIAMSVMYV